MSRREELLDLAARVLEEVGLEEFGVGALARAAGITPPSLYKHFAGIEDIEAGLISRGFFAFAAAIGTVPLELQTRPRTTIENFVRAYRSQAAANPQLYRLMTIRPLRRDLLQPGAETAAMAGLLALFGETERHHDRARAAWAWAHGLVSLEIAGRFPPGVDVDAAWQVLIDTYVTMASSA